MLFFQGIIKCDYKTRALEFKLKLCYSKIITYEEKVLKSSHISSFQKLNTNYEEEKT